MLKNQSIICISSIDWDFIWQGHQQIMSMLAANGNQVLFLENTGVRRPNFRDVPRLRQRIRNWWRGTKGFRQERENLFVYSPLVLPFPYSRIARWINRQIILGAMRRWMKALQVQHPVVWSFLPTPLALDVMRGLEPELVVYYCIDDFQSSSAGARAIRRTEDRLFTEADLVFVTSEKLRARAEEFRDRAEIFPFAVDFPRFESVRESDQPLPDDLTAIEGPIVGYVGGLHRFVDQQMVADAARRMPDVNFVFIGPPQCDLSVLDAEPNVRLLGMRSHPELPSYIKGFDVGIVPYVFDEYTANVYPTKLNEYLAMGIPVVATGLPEIESFNRRHGDIVAIANDSEELASQIRSAMASGNGAEAERRIAVARENGWDARVERMSTLIEAEQEAKRTRQVSWDERLRRVYRASSRRLLRTTLMVAALYLLVFHTPLIWAVAAPLRMSEPPRAADAIVVFAGGVGESGEAGGGYQERVGHAVELYQAGYAPVLVFSSGFRFAFREAEIMRGLAMDLGVPAEAIVLEQEAGSTYENVVFVREILEPMGARSILLVSSPYHMRRAIWTWEEQAPEIEPIASPVPTSQFYSRRDRIRLEQIRGILWEYMALGAYALRGWL